MRHRCGGGIEVDFSLPAKRVVRSLNQIIEWRRNMGIGGITPVQKLKMAA